ncbi:hypothetical protein EDF46_0146 [Frondihabitans sp. PhB188]|uniref:hypothetical protein n=1 Tax=Frondihabitans sp. PhB188 TaxID=2485200 RepID=UPI000FC3C1F1|nr:hypothetical protein [Frondihabitans sp. PhB188]ROQ40785.1 hypothetical protein EDF46_0146 [Frondihabitans sp. PhB188]
MQKNQPPFSLGHGVFRVSDALDQGIPPERLRAVGLRHPHRGLRSTNAEPQDVVGRCVEYAPLLLPGQAFSHQTAALLWGLPGPPGWVASRADLHVVATGEHRAPRRPDVVGHTAPGLPLATVEGLPVVLPTRAWIQCAERWALDDVVAMADALQDRWSPHGLAQFLPRELLESAVESAAGRRGCRTLADALALSRPKVWSPQETRLRLLVLRAGCREPDELNEKQFAADGTYLGRPDMAYPREKVAIEYEGDGHRVDRATFENDIERRERFAADNWRTLRVTKSQLTEAQELAARLRRFVPAA